MCARGVSRHPSRFHRLAPKADFSAVEEKPAFNIAPREDVVGLTSAAPAHAMWLSWGLLPFWAKAWAEGSRAINAMAETVATKPTFRRAWKEGQRSVMLVDGYLEWITRGNVKLPQLFEVDGGEPFALGGLWEDWTRKDGDKAGQVVRTATVLTVPANAVAAQVHDRMPLVLTGAAIEQWLTGTPSEAEELIRPLPPERLSFHEVSRAVNNVRNKGPEVLEPAQDGTPLPRPVD